MRRGSPSQGCYCPVSWRAWPAPFHNLDPDKFFHATVASVIVIAYNTDKVKGADIPRTRKDPLDPKWEGTIDPALSVHLP